MKKVFNYIKAFLKDKKDSKVILSDLVKIKNKDQKLAHRLLTNKKNFLASSLAHQIEEIRKYGCVLIKSGNDCLPENILSKLLSLAIDSDFETAKKDFFQTITISEKNIPKSLDLVLGEKKSEVLKLVYNHFGYVPYIESNTIIRSVYKEETLKKSQLYHLDYNSENILKIFVYISDVRNEKHGPFKAISVPNWLKRIVPALPVHKSKRVEWLFRFFGKELSFNGPPGTIFAVQTSKMFHAGSRVEKGHERLASIITFRSPTRLRGSDVYDFNYPQAMAKTVFKSALS